MRKTRENKEYVERELPYRLLTEMYRNSRRSLKELGRELHISYHTISRTLSQLEEKYKLAYTLDLDASKLGFSEGRIITVKFEDRPELELLKQRLHKDIFVQDAYLAEGDFDLLLYVIGLAPGEFVKWQWRLRVDFRRYKPVLKISTADINFIGFLPLRNELIETSEKLSNTEKKILQALNSDSRIKLKNVVNKAKTTQMQAIYAIKKMRATGIIKKFTALVQNPTKRLFLAYSVRLTPGENHERLGLGFARMLLDENPHADTSDYDVIINTVGSYDSIQICTFENGEQLSKEGPELRKRIYNEENPQIEKAILTDVLVGKWPFHLDDYEQYRILIKEVE